MLVDINSIQVSDRIRKDFGNIDELAQDIKENGLINPPVVTPGFVLIAGERRLMACKHLGYHQIETRVMAVKDYEHQLRLEISENEKRKGFTFTEGVEWARRLEQVEKLKALERMKNPTQNFVEGGETREIVAQLTGFGSKETLRKAEFIADNASAAIIQKLNDEKISIHRAYTETKAERERLAEENAELRKANLEMAKKQKPEAIEKTVEVERVPAEIEAELNELRMANEKLEEKAMKLKHELYLTGLSERDRLQKARLEANALDKELLWLSGKIQRFLQDVAPYVFVADAFMNMKPLQIKEHEENLKQLEKWLTTMKQAMPCGGEVIEMEGIVKHG